jgi:geranylgeranyl diphosphate synthase type I
MVLENLSQTMLPAIEKELHRALDKLNDPKTTTFQDMLTYHMGWTGEGAGPEAQGKRIRPLILLLVSSAAGGDWQAALPAAACAELIHNFSLVHDDIQDHSDIRRGRPTVWNKWGAAQAINAGDALFILAHMSLLDLRQKYSADKVLEASKIINAACLALSSGQFMDIAFEKQKELAIEAYWPMVSGKTAALLSACAHMGAILGGANKANQEAYRNFGHYLGLAFQVQDDYLGIWGDSALTGKSAESDLVTGKKTLPVLLGLEKKGTFSRRWFRTAEIRPDEVAALADQLAEEGVKLQTKETSDQMTDLAVRSLRESNPRGEAGEALFDLVQWISNRQA